MTLREYNCSKCGNFTTNTSIKEKPLKNCPVCGTELESLLFNAINVSVKDVKCLGQYAEKERKKLGKYGSEDKEIELKRTHKQKCSVPLPKGAKLVDPDPTPEPWDKTLAYATPEEQHKYIMTGVRPIPRVPKREKKVKKDTK